MNAEWLRYFVALAQARNFHAAASELHITPQALSKAIAGLEKQLDLRLVERSHRVEGLTAAGEAFLLEANTILRSFENAERTMAEWQGSEPMGPVTIAGDSLWNHYLLPPILADLTQRFPKIRPKLHEMLQDDVEHWVAAGKVDVGLLLSPPKRSEFEWAEGLSTPYVIAGKPQEGATWQDLGYIVPRFFRRETTSSLDGWPEETYPRRIVAEVELLETAIHLCEAGVGVAFLPELSIRERIAQGTLAVVAEAPCVFHDHLYIIWRKGIRPTAPARELLSALKAL
ncbi:Hydrogen peroxide-inducible protein activator [compost metagenome]